MYVVIYDDMANCGLLALRDFDSYVSAMAFFRHPEAQARPVRMYCGFRPVRTSLPDPAYRCVFSTDKGEECAFAEFPNREAAESYVRAWGKLRHRFRIEQTSRRH